MAIRKGMVVLGMLGTMWLGAASAWASELPPVVKVEKTQYGPVYASEKGMTLYEFKKDQPYSGKSNCTGECAKLWPPVLLAKDVELPKPWGKISRTASEMQLTYEGYPLYTWVGDHQPGEANGQGVKGIWRAIPAAGKPLPW